MYQARNLRNSGTNIVTNEEIYIPGIESPIQSPNRLWLEDLSFNNLKALQNYTRVMQIHSQNEDNGLTGNVGYSLGKYGSIASRDVVNGMMFETVNALAKMKIPESYKEPLLKIGYEGQAKSK